MLNKENPSDNLVAYQTGFLNSVDPGGGLEPP